MKKKEVHRLTKENKNQQLVQQDTKSTKKLKAMRKTNIPRLKMITMMMSKNTILLTKKIRCHDQMMIN